MKKNFKQTFYKAFKNFMQSRFLRRLNVFARRLILPGFEKIPFIIVMKYFVESMVKGFIFQRASAMTYRIFIAIIPMFMALFAAISFLDESIRLQLMSFIQSIVPNYTWPAVKEMISTVIMKQNGLLLYTSFGMGLWMTVLCTNSIITSLNITYFNVPQRRLFSQLWVAFLMTLAFGFTIILSISIFVGASYAISYLNIKILGSEYIYVWAVKILKWLMMLVLIYGMISFLFYFAPADKKYFRLFSAGSTFSTVMLVLLLYCLNIYFSLFPTYNVIYGSIGALFAIMLWLYWSSTIILFGFDLNVSIYVARRKLEADKKSIEHIVLKVKD
jgi:membrane protein